MESRQRTPSVIARLMGLDELPPQEPVQKPQRVLSESYLQRVASIGVREKQYKHNLLRMNFEEQKEVRNSFQVLETLKKDEQLHLSDEKGKANLGPLVTKMAFTRQKYMNTKCSSVDEKLKISENIQELSDVIDSKNDQFPKYLPDGNLKSSCTSVSSSVENHRKSVTKTGFAFRNSVQKHENDIVTGSNGELSLNFHKFARSQLVLNNPHSRIVVLKPKHGKDENYVRYCSSASSNESSHSGVNYLTDFCTPRSGRIHVEVKGRKNLETDMEPSRQRPLVSRELMEELTGRTRHKINFSTRFSRSESKAGDTFAVKYKFLMPPSSSFPDWKNGYWPFSNSDAYVTREARKRLLERWKMNKRSEEVGLTSKGSTLGEMLDMPYHNLRQKSHRPGRHGKKDLDLSKFSTRQSKHDALCNEWYLGLEVSLNPAQRKSMKHNNQEDHSELSCWKHNYEKSQSVPCLNSKDCPSIKACKVLDNLKNTLERDQSNLNFLNPHSSSGSISCSNAEDSNSSQEAWVMKDEMKNNPEDENVSEQNMFSKLPISTVSSASIVADMGENAEIDVADKPLGKSQKQLCVSTTCNLLETVYDSSSHATETLVQQDCQETVFGLHEESALSSPCSFTEPDSLMSLEEAYHPSPISVLEPPFTEDTLVTSEFSRRVTDDMCSLQRHLQLLKSETSDTYSEGPGMIVSSDDETEEGSAGDSKEDEDSMGLFRVEESRDFSYLLDVLMEAGFHGRNLKMDFSTLHSPDCSISLSVFETLEKKFGDQVSWKSSERRLLFDRINAGLMEILHPCMGVPIWAKPVSRRLNPSSDEEMIEEDLWMLLASQEKEAGNKDTAEKALGNEIGKLDLGDDIDAIGKEIERLVIDELVGELVE